MIQKRLKSLSRGKPGVPPRNHLRKVGLVPLKLGTLAGTTIGAIVVYVVRPQRFSYPHVKSIREAITFSKHVVVSRIASYVHTNSDFLVAGRMLGKEALGHYTFAWTVANLPVEKITAVINQVTFPLFSSVQSDHSAVRRYLLTLTEALSLLTFPLAFGLVAEARGFVLVVLGEKWLGAVAPLQVLAAYAAIRSIAPVVSQILLVSGESRFLMNFSVVAAILLPVAFFCGSRWGTVGIALAWLLIQPFIILVACRRLFMKIGISASEYLRSLLPAGGATLFMIVVLQLTKSFHAHGLNPALRLGTDVVIGAGAYAGWLALFYRDRLYTFLQVLRRTTSIEAVNEQTA